MEKTRLRREFLSTPEGVQEWESRIGLTAYEAAKILLTPMRTYFRWKSQGLPTGKLLREAALDRMEAALPRKSRG